MRKLPNYCAWPSCLLPSPSSRCLCVADLPLDKERETIEVEVLFVLCALFIVPSSGFVRWQVLKRADRLIRRWCDDNGLRLVSKQLDTWAFFRGPFALTSSWYRPVYRVTVQDGSDKFRRASVSFGGWLFGVFSGEMRVVWDAGTDRCEIVEKPGAGGST